MFTSVGIACASMRLHIQGLQRIAGVTKVEIDSLQAAHYPTDVDTSCRERRMVVVPKDIGRSLIRSDPDHLYADCMSGLHELSLVVIAILLLFSAPGLTRQSFLCLLCGGCGNGASK